MDAESKRDPSHVPRLDIAIVDQVNRLGAVRPGLLERLIEKFSDQALALLTLAEHDDGDPENPDRMRLGFHSLKGSAASLGAARLSALASQAERDCITGGIRRELLDALRDEFLQSRQALIDYVSGH